MDKFVKPISSAQANIVPPGDKSISHRAVLLTALAQGVSVINNVSFGADVLSSMGCMKNLGVSIAQRGTQCIIDSPGFASFATPATALDCGNSGTTTRLLAGILAGSQVSAVLVGDDSLSKRPMQRVVEPLRAMGASITSSTLGTVPLRIIGQELRAVSWRQTVASAQIKSAILLAGLYATGKTEVIEAYPTRDHTERMLKLLGADVQFEPGYAAISSGSLYPANITVPGDISSAAFFLVLGALLPDTTITVEKVGLNPGRTGLLEVLADMGAEMRITLDESSWEPVGTVTVHSKELRAFEISGAQIPRLIDEIPILAVAACFARGRSTVRDAAELRVKESDRISLLLRELRKMGAVCEEHPDGFSIEGGSLQGAVVESHQDHRLAMALAIAGLVATGTTTIRDAECVGVSYPKFWADLESIRSDVNA